MAAMVAAVFGGALPWLLGHPWPLWPWLLAAALAAGGVLAPRMLAPVYRGWMAFGHVAGWVNTRVLLGLVFYLLMVPLGLVMRAFGYVPMGRRRRPGADSYRVPRADKPAPEDMERPF